MSKRRLALAVEGLGAPLRAAAGCLERTSRSRSPPATSPCLLGLNGAGKTTLFSLVTRLYAQPQGTIRIFGMDIREQPSEACAQMGIVFQQPTLDLDLSVEQNLFYHCALHGMSRRDAARRIAAEIERVGLVDRRRDKVRQLSGGQRRRVEIARALLHRPRLLLLDEPTVGLDIASRQFLLDHVRRLCRDEGLAALWATHLIDEVGEGARVVVLHKGEVLADGAAAQLIGQMRALVDARRLRRRWCRSAKRHEADPLPALLRRHREARVAALPESARPFLRGAGAAAGVAG